MSYILDALKKSQAEQTGEGVALRMDQRESRRGPAPWLTGLILVLVFNLGLLLWIFVFDTSDAVPRESTNPPVTATAEPAPAALPAPVAAEPRPTVQPARTHAAADPAPSRPPAPPPVERIALRQLPARDQTLYNGFIYSTHIYTDDPSLCAIVVDGQRLQAGDAFKGLRVIAITETGVIFEETRRGVTREIEVSVLDLWDS